MARKYVAPDTVVGPVPATLVTCADTDGRFWLKTNDVLIGDHRGRQILYTRREFGMRFSLPGLHS